MLITYENVEKLDMMLSGLGLDELSRRLLAPHFRQERLPRGIEISVGRGLWHELAVLSSGYMRGYFRHAFEEYTLGVIGPGYALPPLDYSSGPRFPADLFLESLSRVDLYLLDIRNVADRGRSECHAAMQLLIKTYDSIFGELVFWASVRHLSRGEWRFAELGRHGGGLLGNVSDEVLASATRMSRRHFSRFKNRRDTRRD